MVLLNGQSATSPINGALSEGSLSGLFLVRDEHATSAQTRLDAVARDLIERFSDSSVDPTLSPTDPGLFTDGGAVFSAATEAGISARISLNNLVDPNVGGALWRLRDGLGAPTAGSVGNATTLNSLIDALTETRVPASGGFIGAARSAVGLASDFLSLVNTTLTAAEADQSFQSSRFDSLKNIELQSGVDTDDQIQKLLLIEQAYSANARVITTIDRMIQTLLEL
ncbi:MAG: flagellar basal body rod C-terminal domain-containing protein [Paracoccaceae bacterium]